MASTIRDHSIAPKVQRI